MKEIEIQLQDINLQFEKKVFLTKIFGLLLINVIK